MYINLSINGINYSARKGEFLLDVCRNNGIHVPSLCSIPGYPPTGGCRLCVVEVSGNDDLVPACSFPINSEISVKTHSPKVIAARKTIAELLLSSHPDDCMFCIRSSSCELQALAVELGISERKVRSERQRKKTDHTSNAIVHEHAKCILCSRCIRVCDNLTVSALDFINRGSTLEVGTAGGIGLNNSSCISCGQCIKVCPTGSLVEKNELENLLSIIQDPNQPVAALLDPAVALAIASDMGLRKVKQAWGLIATALKNIGFSKVYSAAAAADISIIQTAEAWREKLRSGHFSWQMTTSCPAWTHYIEQIKPEWINHLMPVYSPLMAFAKIFREKDTKKTDGLSGNTRLVYFTSCIASKAEIMRPNRLKNGHPEVDLVLSARELVQLMRLFGIKLQSLSPAAPDIFVERLAFSYHLSSVSGGYLEALYQAFTAAGRADQSDEIKKLRGPRLLKTAKLKVDGIEQTWIASSDINEAIQKISMIERSSGEAVLLEIMTCPSGCINGGGQPGCDILNPPAGLMKSVYECTQMLPRINKAMIQECSSLLKVIGEASFNFREIYV